MNPLGIKLRKILLSDDSLVHVEYLKYESISEIYAQAEGTCLLVKNQMSEEDVDWILSYPHAVDILTMYANSYPVSACICQMEYAGRKVNYVESIELNLFHYGQALLIFRECKPADTGAPGPNVIKIYPVKRSDIMIPVVEVEKRKLNDDSEDFSGANVERSDRVDDETAITEGAFESLTSAIPTEEELLRKHLKELFDQKFSFVKVQFRGTRIDRISIPLSDFYKSCSISEGRLKGSWTLFDTREVEELLDKGIADRALNSAFQSLTIQISKYGRIIHAQDRERFHEAVHGIEDDFRKYLAGENTKGKVGDVEIKKTLNLTQATAKGLQLLEDYLKEIMPANAYKDRYESEVQGFIESHRKKCEDFSERVELKIEEMEYMWMVGPGPGKKV